jgi:hypothetical protein
MSMFKCCDALNSPSSADPNAPKLGSRALPWMETPGQQRLEQGGSDSSHPNQNACLV